MFKYIKERHEVKIFCPNCQKELHFNVPDELYVREHTRYPFTFRYIHGYPAHSVTLYIDKNGDIRGQEFGDSITLSNEIVSEMFKSRQLSNNTKPNLILQSIFNTFSTIIDARLPDSDAIHYDIGTRLGQNFEGFFVSSELQTLLEELVEFWKRNGFGYIEDVRYHEHAIKFKVFECFECSHMPNIGRPICKLDEGFLTSLLENKLNSPFEVKELQCFATGQNFCEFQVKDLGRQII